MLNTMGDTCSFLLDFRALFEQSLLPPEHANKYTCEMHNSAAIRMRLLNHHYINWLPSLFSGSEPLGIQAVTQQGTNGAH